MLQSPSTPRSAVHSPKTQIAAVEWRQQATWGALLGGVIALLILLLLANRPSGASLEHDTLDFWFSLRGSTATAPSDKVAILAVDEATLRRWNGRSFDADDVGKLLQLLRAQGVVSAALAWRGLADGSLLSPADAVDATGATATSTTFAADLAASGIAYLPTGFTPQSGAVGGNATFSAISADDFYAASAPFSIGRIGKPGKTPQSWTGEATPQSPPADWLGSAAGLGHLSLSLDADGRVRRMPLAVRWRDKIYPGLALAAALGAARVANADGTFGQPRLSFLDNLGYGADLGSARILGINDARVPLVGGGAMLLNFPYSNKSIRPSDGSTVGGHPETGRTFSTLSISAVLDNPDLVRGLRGRCVVIGPTAPSVSPFYSTPTGARICETELHAVALDNLLSGSVLERAPLVWTCFLTLVLCAITGGFAAARAPLWSGIIVLLCLAASATLSLGLFDQNVWLDISLPWLATGITFLSCVIARARRQERESTRVGSTIEALGQVSEIIATQRQTGQALDRILDWTQNVMRAEGSSILLLDEGGQSLRFVAATGPKAGALKPFSVPLGEGIAGWVAQTGQPAIVNDVRRDARFFRKISDSIDFETESILCVPLRARDTLLGVLEVINREDGTPFVQDDVELLTAIANQAALVLENARLYEMLSRRVVQSESDLAATNVRLQAEKNTLQTVLQSMTDGVVVCDREESVRLVNPAAARLLELRPIAPGEKLGDILPEVKNADANVVQLQRGDPDAPRFLEAHRAPLQSADGSPVGTVWVLADVTERRGIEQGKSDFVSFVAHEMRSPLTSISGFSSMLQRREQPENADKSSPEFGRTLSPDSALRARYLGIIHGESERLTRLINNLLDVARLEAGKGLELQRESVDVAALISQVAESQRGYSSRHALVFDLPPHLPHVEADRDKVAQILINLISNAVKYSPGGTITIEARVVGNEVHIGVRDEGPGIASEQKPHLFERFGRLAPEGQPTGVAGTGGRAKPTGTGLGLFLTRHLVEAHGGRIWLEDNQSGQSGAAFWFSLPPAQPFV